MNKLILSLVAAALALPGVVSAQQIKIGAVDMSKAFQEFYKTKQAQASLNDRLASYKKEMSDREAELRKLQEDGRKLEEDAQNPAFNDENRAEKKKLLGAKLTEFNLLRQTFDEVRKNRENELREQHSRVFGTIVEEIKKVVQEIAKRDGYSLVVDKAVNIYVQDTLDITAAVVKELNKSAPPGGAAAPAPDKKDNPKK